MDQSNDSSELQKWRTLEVVRVACNTAHAMEIARDRLISRFTPFQLGSTSEVSRIFSKYKG
jgi:hypothetical protein